MNPRNILLMWLNAAIRHRQVNEPTAGLLLIAFVLASCNSGNNPSRQIHQQDTLGQTAGIAVPAASDDPGRKSTTASSDNKTTSSNHSPGEYTEPRDYPFGYGIESVLRVAELRERGAVELADDVMSGQLYSIHTIREIATYDTNPLSINWDIQFSEAPSTYNLGLHTLDMAAMLGYAYEETDDSSYLWRGRAIIEDWLDYSEGENLSQYVWYDHSVASRTANLIYFLTLMEQTEESIFSPSFVSRIVAALHVHAEWLYDDNNYARNSNHGIMSDRSLIAAGFFLGSDDVQRWHEKGIERLRMQFNDQFTDEVIHVENSPGYALGVFKWFIDIEIFLNQFGETIGPEFWPQVNQGLYHLALMLEPDLTVPLIGDTFGLRSQISLPDSKGSQSNLETAYIMSQGAEGSAPSETFWVFPQAGYSLSRSRWSDAEGYQDDTWLLFKAGFVGRTAHKHNDDLSLYLYAGGYEILGDSGAYSYEKDDPIRNYMTSALAHSTVIVDGLSFEATTIREDEVRIISWQSSDNYDYVSATNELYDGISIDRHLVFLRPSTILIYDDILSDSAHTYSQIFQLAENIEVLEEENGDVLLYPISDPSFRIRVRQLMGNPQLRIHPNESFNYDLGFLSTALGVVSRRKVLEFQLTGADTGFLTIINIGNRLDYSGVEAQIDDAGQIVIHSDGIEVSLQRRARVPTNESSGEVTLLGIPFQLSITPGFGSTYRFEASSPNAREYEYAWYVYRNGSIYDRIWYSRENALEYTLSQKGAYRIQVFVRDPQNPERKETDVFGSVVVYEDLLTATLVSNCKYTFTLNIEANAANEVAWYIYKNQEIYDRIWYGETKSLLYTFTEPGSYHLETFVRSVGQNDPSWANSFSESPVEANCGVESEA